MNKRHVAVLALSGLTLLMAGCGNQSSPTNGASSSSLLAKKTNTKMNADNLSPQQTVSAIATYAGNKYGGKWADVAKSAQSKNLTVYLYPSNHFKLSDNGEGVAYNVTAGGKSTGLVYTMSGNNITIFKNATPNHSGTKLGTISRDNMVNYINNKGQVDFVNTLSNGANVVDRRNGNSSDNTSSSTNESTKSGKYGNKGPINVPSNMRGTWYSANNDSNSSVTFGAHTIQFTSEDDDGGSNELTHIYKQDSSFLEGDQSTDRSIVDATKNWCSGAFTNVNNLHYLTIRGWCQTAGDGSSYAVHTETINGQKFEVLVQAGGAGFWTESVFYRSKAMAQNQQDRKYDDLTYQDD